MVVLSYVLRWDLLGLCAHTICSATAVLVKTTLVKLASI